MMEIKNSKLHIRKLRLMVHLGCTAAERSKVQPVDVDFIFKFEGIPTGAISDQILETICYDEISKLMKKIILDKEFNLVEKLGYDLFHGVKSQIPTKTLCWIQVTKLSPPVDDLLGGVSFSFGDWDQNFISS
jgi:dihydroneopterin aldolase